MHTSDARSDGRHLALLGGTTTLADCLMALRHLVLGQDLVKGAQIAAYERAFAARIGVRHAVSFSAGRVGLYGLLRAMEVGPGDEVLLQVPTHIVVANAVRYSGAQPAYVDARLDSYGIDLREAERRITPRTRVLLVQHTFGIPVDMDAALALASAYGLEVIEDCVHSLGATLHGKPLGSFGRAAFFSTEETKTISTTMGGMVVTDDAALAARMRSFQSRCAWPTAALTRRYLLKLVLYHGLTHPALHGRMRRLYEHLGERQPLPRPTSTDELSGARPVNYPKRLSNAQASLGLRQLARLDRNLAHRRRTADAITAWLSRRGYDTPAVPNDAEPAFVRYPLWVEDRSAARAATRSQLVLGTWFTSVLEEARSPAAGGYAMGSCPRAELASRHLVNLPTHLRVRLDDVDAIASRLAAHAGLARRPVTLGASGHSYPSGRR